MPHTRHFPRGYWRATAWDFGDDPSIRGGRDKKSVNPKEYWEVKYAMKHPSRRRLLERETRKMKDSKLKRKLVGKLSKYHRGRVQRRFRVKSR